MKKVTIILGVEKDKDGHNVPIHTVNIAKDTLIRELSTICGEVTTSYAKGGYIMQNSGALVVERAIKFETYLEFEEQLALVKECTIQAKDVLNQESVIFAVTSVNKLEFI